jgi:hypothetical protein
MNQRILVGTSIPSSSSSSRHHCLCRSTRNRSWQQRRTWLLVMMLVVALWVGHNDDDFSWWGTITTIFSREHAFPAPRSSTASIQLMVVHAFAPPPSSSSYPIQRLSPSSHSTLAWRLPTVGSPSSSSSSMLSLETRRSMTTPSLHHRTFSTGRRRSFLLTPQTTTIHRRVRTTSSSSSTSTQTVPHHLASSSSSSSGEESFPAASSSSTSLQQRLSRALRAARTKFCARPVTFLLIPVIAALVGWLTNWLAVQMIFYPISYIGIPLWRRPEVPLGLIGWQGILPCKTRTLTLAVTDMVTSQLLSVSDALARLNPETVATLLAPHMPALTKDVIPHIVPSWLLSNVPSSVSGRVTQWTRPLMNRQYEALIQQLTLSLQQSATDVFSLQNCVVTQMLSNRAQLGILFQTCCGKELDFLTNSGLWFGFLLGLIQMVVALFWNNPWSLSMYVERLVAFFCRSQVALIVSHLLVSFFSFYYVP